MPDLCPPVPRPPYPYGSYVQVALASSGFRRKVERRIAAARYEMTGFRGSKAARLDALAALNEANQQQN